MRRILCIVLMTLISPLVSHANAGATQLSHPSAPHRALRTRRQQLARESVTTLRIDARTIGVSINALRGKWEHVARCEVGGDWSMIGTIYSGIGFRNSTWDEYGGLRWARLAGLATVNEQIIVGMRVTQNHVPDQYGCDPGGW